MADCTHEQRKPFILSELRCASLRLRLWLADIDSIGIALKGGMITCEQAVALLEPDARAFLGVRLIEQVAS